MAIKTKWSQNSHALVEMKCDCLNCNNTIEVAVKTDGTDARRIIEDAIYREKWLTVWDEGYLTWLCNKCKPELKAQSISSRDFSIWLSGLRDKEHEVDNKIRE